MTSHFGMAKQHTEHDMSRQRTAAPPSDPDKCQAYTQLVDVAVMFGSKQQEGLDC
jgi:hypothetical protein